MNDINRLFFNHAISPELSENIDLKPTISAIDSASRITNMSAFIVDFDEHKIVYQTDNLLYIDETGKNDRKRSCANPYWELVSEETISKLLTIREHYLLCEDDLSEDEYKKHICTIDYPISVHNHELFITQKFTPLVLRRDCITKIGLFTICHSNKTQIESTIIIPNGRRFRFDFSKKRYIEYNLDTVLTQTEKAILNRARMGLNTKQIAESLFISVNTVKTHRTRIFNKLGVKNISEAIAEIGNYHL